MIENENECDVIRIKYYTNYDLGLEVSSDESIEKEFLEFLRNSENLRVEYGKQNNFSVEEKWEVIRKVREEYNNLYSVDTILDFLNNPLDPMMATKISNDFIKFPLPLLNMFYKEKCHVKFILALRKSLNTGIRVFSKRNSISDMSKQLMQCVYRICKTARGWAAYFDSPLFPDDSIKDILTVKEIAETVVWLINPNDLVYTCLAIEVLTMTIIAEGSPVNAYKALLELEKKTLSQDIFSILFFMRQNKMPKLQLPFFLFSLQFLIFLRGARKSGSQYRIASLRATPSQNSRS